jgi:hypothetical protein
MIICPFIHRSAQPSRKPHPIEESREVCDFFRMATPDRQRQLQAIGFASAKCCANCQHYRGRPTSWGRCQAGRPEGFPRVHALGVCAEGYKPATERIQKRMGKAVAS